jgi:hypothetical protein
MEAKYQPVISNTLQLSRFQFCNFPLRGTPVLPVSLLYLSTLVHSSFGSETTHSSVIARLFTGVQLLSIYVINLGWMIGLLGFIPGGAGSFSLHHRVQNGSGVHPLSYPMARRGSFPGGKVAGA